MMKSKLLYSSQVATPLIKLMIITCRLTKLVREVLFVSMEDLPILKHWRAALRKDYRAHLLQKDQQSS